MKLEGIMLSETSQTKKDKYCIISRIGRILKNKQKNKQKIMLIVTENWLVVVRGEGWGMEKMDEGDQKVKQLLKN